MVSWYRGDREKAIKCLKLALIIFKKLQDKRSVSGIYNHLGILYHIVAQYNKALQCYEKSTLLATQIKDKRLAASVLHNIGLVYGYTYKYDKANRYLLKSLALGREVGTVWLRQSALIAWE